MLTAPHDIRKLTILQKKCFVAYPIVFQQQRGWGPGQTGLSFVGIGIGTLIAIFLEPVWRKIINSHDKDPETGRVAPEASASIMCIGAVLTPIGQLVFSWTCVPTSIHWAIPIAFGIPFGCGVSSPLGPLLKHSKSIQPCHDGHTNANNRRKQNTLCFIYGSNYLAGAYGYFAASALAGNAVMRSIFGATLPLAGAKMYEAMTPRWAGTFLGLLEVALIPIPWAFYRRGERIRARSPVIRQMREEQVKNDRKRAKVAAKKERQQQGGAVVVGGGVDGGVVTAVPKAVGGGTTALAVDADVEKGV